jgi:hypothetical protein
MYYVCVDVCQTVLQTFRKGINCDAVNFAAHYFRVGGNEINQWLSLLNFLSLNVLIVHLIEVNISVLIILFVTKYTLVDAILPASRSCVRK